PECQKLWTNRCPGGNAGRQSGASVLRVRPFLVCLVNSSSQQGYSCCCLSCGSCTGQTSEQIARPKPTVRSSLIALANITAALTVPAQIRPSRATRARPGACYTCHVSGPTTRFPCSMAPAQRSTLRYWDATKTPRRPVKTATLDLQATAKPMVLCSGIWTPLKLATGCTCRPPTGGGSMKPVRSTSSTPPRSKCWIPTPCSQVPRQMANG